MRFFAAAAKTTKIPQVIEVTSNQRRNFRLLVFFLIRYITFATAKIGFFFLSAEQKFRVRDASGKVVRLLLYRVCRKKYLLE